MADKRLYDKLERYDLLIFDMDGTLYYQRGMQIRMALRLIKHSLTARRGLRDLRLILGYRKLREKWDSEQAVSDDELFKTLSGDFHMEPEEISKVIRKWMFDEPMDVVKACRDEVLADTIRALQDSGRKIVIYSDYPTEEKCDALGLSDIRQFYCGMDDVKTMKPNPSGLFHIINGYGDMPKDKVIMVGDRKDRDKAAADAADIDSLILKRFRILRYRFF